MTSSRMSFRDWANINAALALYECELEGEVANQWLPKPERTRLQRTLTRVRVTREKVARRIRSDNGSAPDPLG